MTKLGNRAIAMTGTLRTKPVDLLPDTYILCIGRVRRVREAEVAPDEARDAGQETTKERRTLRDRRLVVYARREPGPVVDEPERRRRVRHQVLHLPRVDHVVREF